MSARGRRVLAFAAFATALTLAGVAYLLHASRRSADELRRLPAVEEAAAGALREYSSAPRMLLRSTGLGQDYGKAAVVPLADTAAPRAFTPLRCERVDYAGGRGICLTVDRGAVTSSTGEVFDAQYRIVHTFPLPGIASRTRVAPNGRLGATTTFVAGDSYAARSFSTRTNFWDLSAGTDLGDLETFRVVQDGKVVDAVDRNYWGVTFAPDSNRFYATLSTGGAIHLIEGDVAQRVARVVRPGVECPALSPDGTRIAYKRREGGQVEAVRWRLHVVDLRTGEDRALAESRSVDDQAQWLDDETVLYAIPHAQTGSAATDVWAVAANGGGTPRLVTPSAWSPAVVREP